jgi:hypothetical protein
LPFILIDTCRTADYIRAHVSPLWRSFLETEARRWKGRSHGMRSGGICTSRRGSWGSGCFGCPCSPKRAPRCTSGRTELRPVRLCGWGDRGHLLGIGARWSDRLYGGRPQVSPETTGQFEGDIRFFLASLLSWRLCYCDRFTWGDDSSKPAVTRLPWPTYPQSLDAGDGDRRRGPSIVRSDPCAKRRAQQPLSDIRLLSTMLKIPHDAAGTGWRLTR